jgi:tetrahydromethanopterin S-methyltransferase subunit D
MPRLGRVAPLADTIVFVGLVQLADVLWVSVLVAATLLAEAHDRSPVLVVAAAGLISTVVRVDWTVLVGLLAVVSAFRALRALPPVAAVLSRSTHHR